MRQVVLLQYVIMVLTLSFFAVNASAQNNTITTCDDVIFDDGEESYPYSENLDNQSTTVTQKICPNDPTTEMVKLIWKSFDVAPGDVLNAYNGCNTNAANLITTTGGNGSGSGPSIADSPGGGWVLSGAADGCITLEFTRNGDGVKGAGWEIWITCEEREPGDTPILDCPDSGLIEVANCFSGTASVDIPTPTHMIGGSAIAMDVTASCSIMGLPAQVDGNGNDISLNLPIGDYEITYTSIRYPSMFCKIVIRIVAPPLACNNDLNVPLSDECKVILTPDLLLENRCHDYGYGYGGQGDDDDDGHHHETVFDYEVTLPNLPATAMIMGQTAEGYPIIDFSSVPCNATYTFHISRIYKYDSDCDGDIDGNDVPVVDQCTGWVTLQDPIAPYIYDNELDEYNLPCYQDDGSLLTTLNETASGAGQVTVTGPGGQQFTIASLSSAFSVLDNCGYDYVVSDWMVVNVDCTSDRFEGFDPDGNGVADDVIWDIMAIEFGDPSIFRKYFRRVQVVDKCGNTSGTVVQCVNIIQPDIVAPVLDVELPCGTDIDPIAMYNAWADGTQPTFATFIPNYDPTPLIVNLGDLDFGGLEDMTFTNESGDEVPAVLEHSSCGYAIDWVDSNPIPVCHEPGNPTGGTYKVFRDWTIYNWCDGHLEFIDVIPQVIKVGDLTPPVLENDIHFSVTGNAYYDCSVDLLVQMPTIHDNCSNTMANAYAIATYSNGQQSLSYSFDENGIARIPNLPIGTVSVDVFATDVCGNSGSRAYTYDVYDVIPPVAICEQLHTISLGANCEVEVPATVFDDGSYDNCGITKFSIARLDSDSNGDGTPEPEDFSDRVWFTEDDLAQGRCEGSIFVVLRVSDESYYDLNYDGELDHGPNVNYCTVEVKIQDRIAPVVAPAFRSTVPCGSPFLNALATIQNADDQAVALQDILAGYPEFAPGDISLGNCQGESNLEVITMNFRGETSTCKDGLLTYTYRVMDGCGNASNVGTATVNVVGESTWEMKFPLDHQVSCGTGDGALIPAPVTISDILTNTGCDFWALHVDEEEFAGIDGNCSKIVRTYKLLNWCTWNPSNTEYGVVERPENLILDNANRVSLRFLDANDDGVNDIDDGDEDNDNIQLLNNNGTVADANEATAYDRYDITTLDNDGDFVLLDAGDSSYQDIANYNAISNFTGVFESYVSAQHYGNIMYRQVIKVSDSTTPEITINQAGPFCSNTGGNGIACRANVNITFSVEDACSSTINVAYRLRPYGGAAIGGFSQSDAAFFPSGSPLGGSLVNNGDGTYTISGVYPLADNGGEASHSFDIRATDGCGNSIQETTTVEVKDCTAPIAYCIFGISVDLDSNGEALLWASDFDAGSYDECTPQDMLQLTFADPSIHPDSTARLFSCFSGEVGTIDVEVWVRDLAGNVSRCTTFINIGPGSNNGCPTTDATGAAAIAGQIIMDSGEAVEQVEVALSGNMSSLAMTSVSGSYTFAQLEQGYDYTITPSNDSEPLNGVSTFDLVLMSKHILGVDLLDSPYKLIAADVNNSGTVTTFDLVILRKLILNIETSFPNNTSWRFVESNYEFADPSNPWASIFPEVMSVNNLVGQHFETDFIGIKVGDVNGTASGTALQSLEGRNAANNMTLAVESRMLEAGETYTIAFNTPTAVEGYQFTLEFDNTKLDLVDVEEGIAKGEHFGLKYASEGVITASWNGELDATKASLFSITFNALEDVALEDVLDITSKYTVAEAYSLGGELLNVALSFEDTKSGYELYQNVPNPFKGTTLIGFNLPTDENVELRIYDVAGKTLQVIQRSFGLGYNEITVDSKELPQAGVLYYTLEAGDFKATRKMVIID